MSGSRVRVTGFVAPVVALLFGLAPNVALAAPDEDDFTQTQLIEDARGTTTGSLVGATREAAEPDIPSDSVSVWYVWTAPARQYMRFDAWDADPDNFVDTALRVYKGSTIDRSLGLR
jgi:hypothetical protein